MKKLNKVKLIGLLFASIFLFCTKTHAQPAAYPNGTLVNYVRTWGATAPESDPNNLMVRPVSDVKQTTQYFDGLGRPIQTVARQASLETSTGTLADIVSPILYDEFGREQYKYLPFVSHTNVGNTQLSTIDGSFKTNPFQQQASFASTQYPGETNFYSKTNFEASPLNRVTDTYAPGSSWAGSENNGNPALQRNVQIKYFINSAADDVKIWNVTNDATIGNFGTYTLATNNNGGVYPSGQLYKNITIDEHKKQVIEFKDKEGKVILKKVQIANTTAGAATADDGTGRNCDGWLCTYYIYDDLNNLRCVIQPRGVELLSQNGWVIDYLATGLAAEQCFRYEYDQRQRMVKKKVPGAGEVYMVYDTRDRLIMTQDANMRIPNNWLVTKYDALNRPTETGMWTDPNGSSTTLSTYLSNAYNSNDNSYPATNTSNYEQLSVTHYDDYAGLPAGLTATFNTSYNANNFATTDNINWPYPQMPAPSNATKGMVTWSQTKVLGTANQFLSTVVFYDDKGRAIQTQSINTTGGTDINTTQFTWAGQPLVMVQRQQLNSTTNPQEHIIISKMGYDSLGRLLYTKKAISSTINGVAVSKGEQEIARNQYDKLGQLKNKKLAPAYNSNAGLETLNYDYNIRGWLLGMNRDFAKDTIAATSNYFGFDLGYDKANNNLINGQTYTNPQYNGNIEGMVWKSKGDKEKRKYDFTYDNANRLLAADFNQYTGGAFNKSAQVDFSVKMGDGTLLPDGTVDYTKAYDANGNIQQMQQLGLKINVSSLIDNLKYTYRSNSNQLLSVTDFNNDVATKLGDFKTANTHPNYVAKTALTPTSSQASFNAIIDYVYDVNGNLNLDNNKAIGSLSYNYLNLPNNITVTGKGTITYTYDAGGNKLKKITIENPVPANNNKTITTTTNYINGLVYETKTIRPQDATTPPEYTDVLQFVPQEEGRIRFNPASGSTGASFAYDYMLKDQLGNVRAVITDEQQIDKYPAATLEPTLVGKESDYYTIDPSKIVAKSSITGMTNINYPNNNGIPNNNPSCAGNVCTTDYSANMYRLNSNTNKTGLGITLKVMAGDKVDVFGKSYYFQNTSGTGGNSLLPVTELLTSFLGAPAAAATTSAHGTITATTINTPSGTSGINNLITQQTNQSNASPNAPRAFINVIFFDEQFKAVDFKTSMVGANSTLKEDHFADLQNLMANKSGFVYIYCSNESPVDVFFDNLQVVQTRSPILEETHYYPFGLTMSGISSSAAGTLKNKYKFGGKELQSNEFSDNSGLEAYDFGARNYDPQIGRWWTGDPKADKLVQWSPYNYCLNNPIIYTDPNGLYPIYVVTRSYAPYASFGPGNQWKGDNRGPTLDKAASYRTAASINYDTETKTHGAFGGYSRSSTVDGSKSAISQTHVKDRTEGDKIDVHSYGNNAAQKGSWDIDQFTKLDVKIEGSAKKDHVLNVSGTISGDNFPYQESMIYDSKGNTLWLGNSTTTGDRQLGPVMDLARENEGDVQINVNVRIKVDKNGVFQGVMVQEKGKDKVISIADWNKKFEPNAKQ